jgi:Restriction endonuclease BglII
VSYWVTADHNLIRKTLPLLPDEQKRVITEGGGSAIATYNQTDFVKDRIAIEVQFGKYSFVAFDMFVKHMAFFVSDKIDVGVEILPMKALQEEMSSGVPYYERGLYDMLRQGRGIPAVPLVVVGIEP